MSNAMFEKLWPAFFDEVSQQLGSLAEALKDPENLEFDVDQVFRDFHTIGSSCAMMGFTSMQEIARTAEDVLGKIRSYDLELVIDISTLLLEASNCLSKQLAIAEDTKENPSSFPELAQKLQLLLVEE